MPNPVLLTVGPWSHTFGCMVLINFVSCHRRVIFLSKFVDRHYLAAIQVHEFWYNIKFGFNLKFSDTNPT